MKKMIAILLAVCMMLAVFAGCDTQTETNDNHETQLEQVMYGSYNPLSVTLTHILNNKSGVSFTSYSHTGLPVAVLADGLNAEVFNGYFDNTDIYNKLAQMLNIQ